MTRERRIIDSLLGRSLPVAVVSVSIVGSSIVALPTYRTGLYLFTIVLLFAIMFLLPHFQYWKRWCKRDFARRSTRFGAYALAILVLGNGETMLSTLFLAIVCLTWIAAVHFTEHWNRSNASLLAPARALRILLTLTPIFALVIVLRSAAFVSQLGALLTPLTTQAVQNQLVVIILLVILGIILLRTLGHLVPAYLDWTIVTLVAAGCSLTVFMHPDIGGILYNYPYYTGAAQQSALGHSFNLGVSQYGHGPQVVILAIHALSDLSISQSLLVGTMVVNCFFYSILALSARTIAGNFWGVFAAGAVVVPALFSQGSIVSTPSVAGMRFLPLAALVLIVCLIFPVSRYSRHFPVFHRVLIATGLFAITIAWNVDGAAMSLAFAIIFAIILLCTQFRESAVLLSAALASGVVVGTAMSYIADPSNFMPWAAEFYAVAQAYSHGLGAMPVFKFTFSDPAAVTSLWVLPIIIVLVSMDIILSDRKIVIIRQTILIGLFALAMITLSYFVGRAHSNNLLHVAPFTIAFVIAAVGFSWRTHVSTTTNIWPYFRQQERSSKSSNRIIGTLIVVLLTALLVAQGRELLSRYPDIDTSVQSRTALTRSPLLLGIFSSYPQTPFVMALDPANLLAVGQSANRPNFATYGWPEQDAFGGGITAQVERVASKSDCVIVGSELHSAELPATEVTAVAETLDIFPRVLRRWTTTEFWIELRSKSWPTHC